MRVQQTHPKGLRHAGARVVRRAPADAHDELPETRVQRLFDGLAQAIGRCHQRIATLDGKKGQPRGPRHLDDGGVPIAHGAPLGFDSPAERPRDLHGPDISSGAFNQRFEGAISAVGHGNEIALGLGDDSEHPVSHGLGDVERGDTTLERLGSQYDFHCSANISRGRWTPREGEAHLPF